MQFYSIKRMVIVSAFVALILLPYMSLPDSRGQNLDRGILSNLTDDLLETVRLANAPTQQVYILVNSTIYRGLEESLERWMRDVETTGFNVTLHVITQGSASEIRTLLQNASNLVGCLMVGDIPYAIYETTYEYPRGVSHYETFPTDLYYMDLNGIWLDVDGNGLFDTHEGDIAPEIWVSRLRASPLSGNEVQLLRNYFDKNHDYRVGNLTLPQRALIYTDHYFNYYTYDLTPKTESILKEVFDEVEVVAYPQETTAEDYLMRLQRGWTLVRLCVHSGGFGHYFGNQTDGKVEPLDIKRNDPKAFFYIITSCGNFDYRQRDYIGGWYVFSKSYGLIAIGESGAHDLFAVLPEEFFLRLKGECFGQAYLHYLRKCVEEGARIDSVHNAVMLGDPLLTIYPRAPAETIKKVNGVRISEHFTCKNVSSRGDWRDKTDRFNTTDPAAYVWWYLEDLTVGETYHLRYVWINPRNETYAISMGNFTATPYPSRRAWAWIYIRGHEPERLPGEWRCEVYYREDEGDWVHGFTERFTIQGPPQGLPGGAGELIGLIAITIAVIALALTIKWARGEPYISTAWAKAGKAMAVVGILALAPSFALLVPKVSLSLGLSPGAIEGLSILLLVGLAILIAGAAIYGLVRRAFYSKLLGFLMSRRGPVRFEELKERFKIKEGDIERVVLRLNARRGLKGRVTIDPERGEVSYSG
jgi:hypothetical protein